MRRARLGDVTDHDGVLISASPDVLADGIGVCRVGDTHDCPIHGLNPIVTGSSSVSANGLPVARIGDLTECGATILSGSPGVDAGG